jgi:hypothetical protein
MKSKSYVEDQLNKADSALSNLINDLDNNRPYVTKEYIMERLDQIQKSVILTQNRIVLEDENS